MQTVTKFIISIMILVGGVANAAQESFYISNLQSSRPTIVEDSIASFLEAKAVMEAPTTMATHQKTEKTNLSRSKATQRTYSESEKMCMATAIYYEARGEPVAGQVAVGHVIKNRANSDKYPDDVCAVVTQRTKSVCQFSWFCQTGMRPVKFIGPYLDLAEQILFGEKKDPTGGAMFFHTTSMGNVWKKKVKARIGAHTFY